MEDAAMPYDSDDFAEDERIVAVEAAFLDRPGVVGVGIGDQDLGSEVVVVYVIDKSTGASLPKAFEGMPVVAIVSGEIDAY